MEKFYCQTKAIKKFPTNCFLSNGNLPKKISTNFTNFPIYVSGKKTIFFVMLDSIFIKVDEPN